MHLPAIKPDARIAIITPSYSGDLERCELLCETLDQAGGDGWRHLLLVSDQDYPRFRHLSKGRREVVPDSIHMPRWLKPMRLSPRGKTRWISLHPLNIVWPMSGWHVQQLRKLHACRLTDAPLLLMADSDTVFLRPVNAPMLLRDGKARLYVKRGAITAANPEQERHLQWLAATSEALGLPRQELPADDYVNNLVTWRRDVAEKLLERIEATTGRDIVSALGRRRSFSEYQLYGEFADRVLMGEGHWRTDEPLGHTYWGGAALDEIGLARFLKEMRPTQIAFGIQSFTGTSLEVIKKRAGAAMLAAE
jgi:hypothetical protein